MNNYKCLVISDTPATAASIRLNLMQPAFQNEIYHEFQEYLEVIIAAGTTVDELTQSCLALCTEHIQFAVTSLDMQIGSNFSGGEEIVLGVNANVAIASLGQISICTEKVEEDSPQVQRLIRNFSAAYFVSHNRPQRQHAVQAGLRAYVESLKRSS